MAYRFTFLMFIATLSLISELAYAQDWSRIRIATEGAYAPWNATDPSGRLIGFEVDLAGDLCRRMRADCTVVGLDWDGMIPALQQGKLDAIMAGMVITDARLAVIDFAGPYANEPSVFMVPDTSPLAALRFSAERVDLNAPTPAGLAALHAMADGLAGKTVGVQTATVQAAFLERHVSAAMVRVYDTLDRAAMDLRAGRIDALMASRTAAAQCGPAARPLGPEFVNGVLGRGVGVGMRKGDPSLKERFNAAIGESYRDGTLSGLSKRWFGFDVAIPPQ